MSEKRTFRAVIESGEGGGALVSVPVTVEEDTEPRVVDVPPDLKEALRKYPKAEAFLQLLSYTHQREYVRWVEEAKRAETRRDRITRAVTMLEDGKKER